LFDSQNWIPMSAADESYWSDAVTAHEIGHWAMASFGKSPDEGGKHFLNCATYPGQAWSEGWATLFSSMTRNNTTYHDKQGGSFFWFDINTPASGSGSMWPSASPSGGLLQLMAENEVARLGWRLTKPPGTGSRLETNGRMFRALAGTRMISSPFARGYTRHSWDVGSSCGMTSVSDHGYTVPMFADFLDGLACGGETTDSEITAAVLPSTTYPYYPSLKLCK
jgi:hypothetical protein